MVITGLLGVLTLIHDLDDIRQGRALPAELYAVAVAALVFDRLKPPSRLRVGRGPGTGGETDRFGDPTRSELPPRGVRID